MNCQEIQNLWGLFHDQELDQAQSERVIEHLKNCSSCARFFQVQDRFEHSLASALNRGVRNAELWQGEEKTIRQLLKKEAGIGGQDIVRQDDLAALESETNLRPAGESALRPFKPDRLASAWRSLFGFGPKYYAALASVWILLLAVNFSLKGGAVVTSTPAKASLTPPGGHSSLHEYRRELLLELANMEAAEEKPVILPSPRSERPYRSRDGAFAPSHMTVDAVV